MQGTYKKKIERLFTFLRETAIEKGELEQSLFTCHHLLFTFNNLFITFFSGAEVMAKCENPVTLACSLKGSSKKAKKSFFWSLHLEHCACTFPAHIQPALSRRSYL